MSMSGYMDDEPGTGGPEVQPEEEDTGQEGAAFDLISVEDFYDLLMEQQEQM